ncbi:trypsin-like serine peptidase [Arthrobacter sp. NPDC092385]|uniref:trypsin-like serine peptidase n=1 Tax=Arthrobacter sp. NPDC092385 TaxID=3363943 RepID=UPI0038264F6F
MNSRGLTAGMIAASALLASALMAAGPVQAAPSAGAVGTAVAGTTASHAQDESQAALDAYWTEDRMRGAKPANTINSGWAAEGRSIMPKAGQESITKAPREPVVEARATAQAPVSRIGKVFFTMDGQNYVCSGNSVQSGNQSTVATAGHCTHDLASGWATNFVFVPAYSNGAAPYGKWTARSLHAAAEWVARNDINYDGAFAVVNTLNGKTLSATVGASSIGFNMARSLTYSAYGYPAASPFNGERLYSCYGTASADRIGGTQSQGIPCDMTGGSSGGPWFVGSGAAGTQNSVNSFGYSSQKNVMYGPYFGSSIQSAYSTAAGR